LAPKLRFSLSRLGVLLLILLWEELLLDDEPDDEPDELDEPSVPPSLELEDSSSSSFTSQTLWTGITNLSIL
jgi:hypothetical protein